jgi:hypothetical protein
MPSGDRNSGIDTRLALVEYEVFKWRDLLSWIADAGRGRPMQDSRQVREFQDELRYAERHLQQFKALDYACGSAVDWQGAPLGTRLAVEREALFLGWAANDAEQAARLASEAMGHATSYGRRPALKRAEKLQHEADVAAIFKRRQSMRYLGAFRAHFGRDPGTDGR